jgi:hypothetical protein
MATPSWLRYTNTGATRNQPLSQQLIDDLDFLGDMGITMDVFSGGQPSSGSNRVGSHRHDNGSAADVFFSEDGRRLDWANASDRPIFEDIVKRAKAAGVTGFGAGDGYMQPGSMHIGYGSPSVWGAGGKGASAPDWLREAFGAVSAPGKVGGDSMVARNMDPQVAAATNTPATEPTSSKPPEGLLALLKDGAGKATNSLLEALMSQDAPRAPKMAPMPAPQTSIPPLLRIVQEYLASRRV